MGIFKEICRDMAANPNILTFSDIAKAAANGAVVGQKVNQPLVGAVLGVSLEAGKRAVKMTEELIKDLSPDEQNMVVEEMGESKKSKPIKPKPTR